MPIKPLQSAVEGEVYSVSRLNEAARRLLESGLAGIWVSGEISNLARPASGHIYFSLKDADAQVRCAMFKGSQRRLKFRPENGTEVVLQGKVSIYTARGDYQIVVDQMEEAGEGQLRRAFDALKAQLDKEGLFDLEHKQALPALPRTIGVITSPTGAAIRDVLKVLKRRYPAASIIVYPTRVQGDGAAEEIVAALRQAEERQECDVLILTRGGGSLEDLWSFNEEVLARAVFACKLPIVAGVGHEVDTTIADLVADARAPTPSAAAELVVPEAAGLLQGFRDRERRLMLAMQRSLDERRKHTEQLGHRLQRMHPGAVLQQLQQRVDDLNRQMLQHMQRLLTQRQQTHTSLRHRLLQSSPLANIRSQAELNRARLKQLRKAVERILTDKRAGFARAASALNAVSPLNTLERGYAIVTVSGSDRVVQNAAKLKAGDTIEARLKQGQVEATVTSTRKK